jgi:hypothetical protein
VHSTRIRHRCCASAPPDCSTIPARQPARETSNFTDRRHLHLRFSVVDILAATAGRTEYCLSFAVCRLRWRTAGSFFSLTSIATGRCGRRCISAAPLFGLRLEHAAWSAHSVRLSAASGLTSLLRRCIFLAPSAVCSSPRFLCLGPGSKSSPPTPAPRTQFLLCHDHCWVIFAISVANCSRSKPVVCHGIALRELPTALQRSTLDRTALLAALPQRSHSEALPTPVCKAHMQPAPARNRSWIPKMARFS